MEQPFLTVQATTYHLIATLVDPDNDHLVENVKSQLQTLNESDFGFNVQKILAESKNQRRFRLWVLPMP